MGFYLRKSASFGPFRLNFSKSGVGLSTGVKGFRVGTGPRGSYVHAGRGGVYYRQSLDTGRGGSRGGRARGGGPRGRGARNGSAGGGPAAGSGTLAPEAVPIPPDAVPAGGGDVVRTLDQAAAAKPTALTILVAGIVVGLFILPYGLILWAVAVVCAYGAHRWDAGRRNAHVTYRVEDEPLSWFNDLSRAVMGLRGVGSLRRVYTGTTVGSAAARAVGSEQNPLTVAQMARRDQVHVHAGPPKHLITNVAVPQLTCGPNALYFLPDRLLVRGGKKFGAVHYDDLHCTVGEQFVQEKGTGPPGAEKVRTTWEHARKDGERDRRYKRNRRVTVVRYTALTLHSAGGLHWLLQCSGEDAARALASSLADAPAMPELTM